MLNDDFVKLILVLILSINTFIVGYFLGKTNNSSQQSFETPNSFLTQKKTNKPPTTKKPIVEIDDRKFVGEINTDSLEKKYESLGEIKTSSENISSAISKLKSIKS